MDRTLGIILGILIIVFAAVTAMLGYSAFTDYAYRSTLSGNYTYLCTVTTDAPLYNVTLFVPVPVDTAGNSPTAAAFSSGTIAGIPSGWETTLFDTGKSTLVKITAPAIIPPQGTKPANPFTISLSSETLSQGAIDTVDPVNNSVLFRPVRDLKEQPSWSRGFGSRARSFSYTTAVYAEYSTASDTTVTITSAITGRNSWKVLEPASNEYHADVTISMKGTKHGWETMDGELTSGSGTYIRS
ncbi:MULTISPECIES: hypothetical protein [unclassified Methanoregula]|uniref:hypothetical protein n=1 Tax=unclassified Methanoregula TaxID=2649730 RepID=UPI0009C742F4|nr:MULTISPECIES: hypothetical protein [unclassified Methanoregula]OPX62927.1 MAG: hypothetical protein A4E33_02057 [Methanoregula sp. PtaB.Bin085]OPY35140.1 MAG: hypothetical protein A4E34_00946 [Methanoregula sp. PtaU1.Bin006]